MREQILMVETNPAPSAVREGPLYRKYDVRIANDRPQALEICRAGRPSAIIVVMEGPNDRELSLLRELKAQDRLERPIIAITGHNSLEIERAIATIGVFYHLLGPYMQNDLDDLIAAALRSWNKKSLVPKVLADKGQAVKK